MGLSIGVFVEQGKWKRLLRHPILTWGMYWLRFLVGLKYIDQFVIDMINSGAGTAFNMNSNEVITNVALIGLGKKQGQYEFLHPNDHVNMSQSSNDTYPTAMHMAILFSFKEMIPAIDKLIKSINKKAKQFSKYKKLGRTHLMDALPVTLGSEFAAYATSLTNARNQIIASQKELEQVALGGTAVGTGANTPKGYRKTVIAELSKISKLSLKPQKDMQYALQSKFPELRNNRLTRGGRIRA